MEKPRILIADDDPDDRIILLETFTQLGYSNQVKVVDGGMRVIDYLYNNEPKDIKLIVLDMNMPSLSGIETLQILKSHSHHKEIRVVIFSTLVNESDKNICKELGAHDFIVKPTRYLEYVDICNNLYEISCSA